MVSVDEQVDLSPLLRTSTDDYVALVWAGDVIVGMKKMSPSGYRRWLARFPEGDIPECLVTRLSVIEAATMETVSDNTCRFPMTTRDNLTVNYHKTR
jgi:hypothetical protein